MPKAPGSIWIESTELHFVDQAGEEYLHDGEFVSNQPTAKPGSIWVEGDYVCYIDATSNKRRIPNILATSSPAGMKQGSLWAEISRLHWYSQNNQDRLGHNDVVHIDTHNDVGHSDATHVDVPFVDTHGDSHGDATHTDTPHSDSHTDTHGDSHGDLSFQDHTDSIPFSDSHTDTHGDSHSDHGSYGQGNHTGHMDCPKPYNGADRPAQYQDHDDIPNQQGQVVHCDYHDDIAHADHSDVITPHTDVPHQDRKHSDTHSDSHSDIAHQDKPPVNIGHSDTHSDVPHSDISHLDTGHQDIAFVDVHTDSPHLDMPKYIGP